LARARLDEVESGSDDGRWSFQLEQPLAFDVWVESRILVPNIKLGIGPFSDRGIEVAYLEQRRRRRDASVAAADQPTSLQIREFCVIARSIFPGYFAAVRTGSGRLRYRCRFLRGDGHPGIGENKCASLRCISGPVGRRSHTLRIPHVECCHHR
jgi:hypothetical protein